MTVTTCSYAMTVHDPVSTCGQKSQSESGTCLHSVHKAQMQSHADLNVEFV